MKLKELRKDINRRVTEGEHFSKTELRALSLQILRNHKPCKWGQKKALQDKHKEENAMRRRKAAAAKRSISTR